MEDCCVKCRLITHYITFPLNIVDIFNEIVTVNKEITGALSFEILEIRIPLIDKANINDLGNIYDKKN